VSLEIYLIFLEMQVSISVAISGGVCGFLETTL